MTGKEIKIEKLDASSLKLVYYGDMQRSFPADELKPYAMMENMQERGLLTGFGCFAAGEMCAYAYFVEGKNEVLLDYFAVLPKHRGSGVGSLFLKRLKRRYADYELMLFEVETPEDSDPSSIQNRRIAFYRRLGVLETGVRSLFFGVDFTVLYLPLGVKEAGNEELCRRLQNIYRGFLSDEIYRNNVALRCGEEKR